MQPDRHDVLRAELANTKATLAALQTQLQEANERSASLQSSLADSQEEVDRLKEELGATTQRYTSAVEQVSDAVAKAIAAEAALAKFKAEANTRLAGYVAC